MTHLNKLNGESTFTCNKTLRELNDAAECYRRRFVTHQHRLNQELLFCIHAFSKFWQIFQLPRQPQKTCIFAPLRRWSCDECDSRKSKITLNDDSHFRIDDLTPILATSCSLILSLIPPLLWFTRKHCEHFHEVQFGCCLSFYAMLISLRNETCASTPRKWVGKNREWDSCRYDDFLWCGHVVA